MKWFVRFSPIALMAAYGLYFFFAYLAAPSDWKRLEQSFSAHDKVQAKASVRKEVTKHIFYTKDNLRESFNFQAQDSTVYIHPTKHGLMLQEELEGMVGSFWHSKKQRFFHLYMPYALFDYPRKNLAGYHAELDEFDPITNSSIGKSEFAEIECSFKNEPVIKLKRIHAQVFKDP